MAVSRTPLIAGNWKMNLDHLQSIAFVQKLAWSLRDAKHDYSEVEVAVFPPFTDLRSVQTLVTADKLDLRYGGQDLSEHDAGAFTGEVSGAFLAALDCRYVIIGHSERRQYFGETDATVNARTKAALAAGLIPIVCVGETLAERDAGNMEAVVVRQTKAGLDGLGGDLAKVVIAYEPVWAIGTGRTASPAQAQEVHALIRRTLAEIADGDLANTIRIQYGGSMKPENAKELMSQPDIDGGLIGGAALKADSFAAIVKAGE